MRGQVAQVFDQFRLNENLLPDGRLSLISPSEPYGRFEGVEANVPGPE